MNKITLYITTFFSIISGLLHSTLVSLRNIGATPPLEAAFFFFGGIAQLGLGIFLFKSKSIKSAMVLFVVNGSLAILWILTRVFRAPFMDSPKGIGILGFSIFIFELIAMVSIGLWKWSKRHDLRELYNYSYIAVTTSVLFLSLLFSSMVYAGGRVGEKFMPNRQLKHEHKFGGHSLFGQKNSHTEHDHNKNAKSHRNKNNITSTKNNINKESDQDKKQTNKKKSNKENTKDHQGHSSNHSH